MTTSDAILQPSLAADPERPVFLLGRERQPLEDLALELRHHGWRTRTFLDASKLRSAAEAEPPLAVVADVSTMPQFFALPQSPPLLCFGSADFSARLQAVRLGAKGYFPLPINRSALLHRLAALGSLPSPRTGRILLVDGPQQSLRPIAPALTAQGLQTDYLDQPERVLELLQQEDFELLLIHDTLAQMRGSELLQIVRLSWRFHALPAILLTWADKRYLDAEATAAGADAVLGLPIAMADLAAVARARLTRSRQLLAMCSYSLRRDPDTGLFNRDYFLTALRQAMTEADAGHGRATLLWLEIAPRQGERLDPTALMEVASILQRQLPPLALAAHLGANAFAVLLPAMQGDALEQLTALLGDTLRQRLQDDCLLGINALGGRQQGTAEALEQARQAALRHGEPLAGQQAADGPWAAIVREALQQNRFRLVYQPIASLSGLPSSYYEVFLRMLAEDGRDILPQEFLPTVEKAGLSAALDRWVLARTVDVLASQRHLRDQPVLFVKLLPATLAQGSALVTWLADRLQAAALEPSRLVLQLRQQCAETRPEETRQFVTAVRRLGCGVALEHFNASGERGRQLLQALRPDFVRLDAQLTRDIGTNIEHQRLVEMIASQCRTVGAKTIAALVQDAVHLSTLWRCGLEYIQGYFMQEPADVFAADETRPQP